jgi:hypothetical protein
METTEYEINAASDGFAQGGLLTVYDDGKATVRTVIQRCEPGMNGSWHVIDDNPDFPREMLQTLLNSLIR